LFTLKHIQKT